MQAHGYSAAVSPLRLRDAESLVEDARQFVEEGVAAAPEGASFAIVSFSTGGALGICLTRSLGGTPLQGRCVGHYAMAPLVVSPYPWIAKLTCPCCCACCPGCLVVPYKTNSSPHHSFIHRDVYEVEVKRDALNWGGRGKARNAAGNVAVMSALCSRTTAAAAQIALPIRVAKGDRDGVLDGRAHTIILRSPYARSKGRGAVLRMFEGQVHCLINGPEGEALVADIEATLAAWFEGAAAPVA